MFFANFLSPNRNRQGVDSSRLRSMVENMPVNVLLANRDLRIIYMNESSRRTLTKLKDLLPIPVEKITGASIDVFHSNPSHQRKLLANPDNLPHRANITLGEHTLNLLVSAVTDTAGRYLGPMVTWEIVTDKVRMLSALDTTSNNLNSTSQSIGGATDTVSSLSQETRDRANQVAAAAEQANVNISSIAASMQQLAQAVQHISESAQQGNSATASAVEACASATAALKSLEVSAGRISNVTDLINTIGEQTSMLALNATIQAASAGEAGKSFTVVANEIKDLAVKSQAAAADIAKDISTMHNDTHLVVEQLTHLSTTIDSVSELNQSVAAAVEEQSQNTNSIDDMFREISAGVSEISSNISAVSNLSDSVGPACDNLTEAGGSLQNIASELSNLTNEITKSDD